MEKPARILIADDEALNRDLMKLQVQALGYGALLAAGGREALALAAERLPDAILLDVMMPGMDGFEVAARLKADPRTAGIPVIIVSALDDAESRRRGLDAGAEDFLTRPADRAELKVRLRNLLRLKVLQDELAAHSAVLEKKVLLRAEELDRGQREIVLTLIGVAAHKDDESGAHVKRIGICTEHIAQRLGMNADFCNRIALASRLHDIGKIAIPDRILDKREPLTPDEWVTMKTHSALGAHMLSLHSSPYLAMAAEIALAHHERWDGSGYPRGLAGEAIALAARITHICDLYDVLRCRRPYRERALEHAEAVQAIVAGDGRSQPGHFDPGVLSAFRMSADAFGEIFEVVRD